MKTRILLLCFIIIGCAYGAVAQVQADKQLQMTGGSENDRRITGVGTAADTADAVNVLGLQNNRLTFAEATVTGNAFAIALKVSPGTYKAGLMVSFKAPAANTGAITLNVNGLGAKAVYKNVDQALAANDIAANQVVSVLFDGTAFQVISQLKPASGFTGALSGEVVGTQNATVINNGAITTDKVADGAITNAKLAGGIDYSKLTGAPTAMVPTGSAGGDLTGSYPAPVIADGVVSTSKIGDGAVSSLKIQDGAIISLKLADGSVLTAKIADAAITTAKIADGAVSSAKLVDGAITESKIATDAVSTTHIKDGAVTDAKINTVSYSKITGAPTALTPTGAAGGDLDGLYPNPAIAAGAVSTAKIAAGAVTDEKITSVSYSKITGAPTAMQPTGSAGGDLSGVYPNPVIATDAVTSAKIAAGAVTTDKINTAGAVNGQVLAFNGISALWSDPAGATGAAGGDLTGSYPNPAIATGAVSSTKIADGAIANNHINASANIAYSKLNLSNSIVGPDITADAITTPKLANGAVTTTKISTAGAASGQVLTYNGSNVTWATVSSAPTGAAGGDLFGSYPNPTVATGTITSAKIADGAITNADVNASAAIAYSKLNLTNSIVTADITNSAITAGKIKDGAITTAKIQDEAITDAKIADGISYSKLIGAPTSLAPEGAAGGDLSGTYPNPSIATDAVTTIKIADGAITPNKLTTGAVTTEKISNGSVTTEKISTAGASNGQFLMFDGAAVSWASPASAGTGASLQFHGTITSTTAYNSGSKVVFNNALTNNSAQMNTATGTFTTAASGLYQINASLPSSAEATRFLALRVNGTDVFTGSAASSFAAPSPYNATISALSLSVAYPLNAGDQVEVVVYNNSGTATPLINGSSRLLITKLN